MRKIINIFKWVLNRDSNPPPLTQQPVIIPREKHNISRKNISPAALKVLYRLKDAGYSAYLVGGSVRDLLLGLMPKDFDVVTNALPEDIQGLFKYSYIIGRRFRLVHVRFGQEVIEVATFRGNTHDTKNRVQTKHGLLLRDNVYGSTLEDDVWRRDFTMNALYYNIADFSVIDYVGGMADLESRTIRVIGNPAERYQEDPARMLRAIRLAAKLDFDIEAGAQTAIYKYKKLLEQIPHARLFDKLLKIFHSGKSLATFKLLEKYDLVPMLFPQVAPTLTQLPIRAFIESALINSDERINQGKNINSAFLFAVLLWQPLQQEKQTYLEEGYSEAEAFHLASNDIISKQLKSIAIPKRFTLIMREIWNLQHPLEQARVKRIYRLVQHTRFRAAYDFLQLRSYAQEGLSELVQWWTDFQEADQDQKEALIQKRFAQPKSKRRRRKPKTESPPINAEAEAQGD